MSLLRKRLFWVHSTQYSHRDCAPSDSGPFAPRSEWKRFAEGNDKSRAAPITRLFGSRRPAAVTRFVVTVIVAAFDLMLWRRSFSHIRKKVFEAFPSLAHNDPSSAVIWKRRTVAVCTASSDLAPNVPLRGTSETVAQIPAPFTASFFYVLTRLFAPNAATAHNTTSVERCRKHFLLDAAIAPDKPPYCVVGLFRRTRCFSDYEKLSTSSPDEVAHALS